MVNAVIDLSNIFYRSMFNVSFYGSEKFTFNSQDQLDKLMRKVSIDLSSIIKTIEPERIVIAVDSKSWRKQISIDENEGYKGHRTKDQNLNWNNIFNTMDEFSKILEENGMIVSKIKDAEADDLMALWTEEFVNRKEHVILVSGDEDIRQLVDLHFIDKTPIFVTVFNPFTQGKNASKKLFYPNGLTDWIEGQVEIDQMSSFFHSTKDLDKELFKSLINNPKIKPEEIYGPDIALYKIFCGDDGDNVPAFYSWMKTTLKGDLKPDRITPAKYNKLKEQINLSHPNDLQGEAIPQMIKKSLLEITKQKEININIKNRLDRQIKLVYLNSKWFPKSIVEDFNKKKDKELEKPKINPRIINMNSILKNSKYISEDYNKNIYNEESIFKDLDNILNNKELF